MSTLKNVHQFMWSAVGMVLVLGAFIVVARLVLHQHPTSCPTGIEQTYYRTVTSYDTSWNPPAKDGIAHIPVFVCKNGQVVSP